MRNVTIELVFQKTVKEFFTTTAKDAATYLKKRMQPGWKWRITPPDRTGQLPDDEQRFAADCAACGVHNPYNN